MPRLTKPADLADLKLEVLYERQVQPVWVTVCTGTGCCAYGAEVLADGFQKEIEKRGVGSLVGLRRTGCHGFCERGPLVVIQPKDICYLNAQIKDIPQIMDRSVLGDEVIERLLYLDEETGKRVSRAGDIPFYQHQQRILLANNSLIDSTSIRDYMAVGGYEALAKALGKITPLDGLHEVKRANLRGRGGGGFPAAVKWESARKAAGTPKYVIVNGDEGDPGAYMAVSSTH